MAAQTLHFHGYFRSSAAYRCRIAFGLKHISPDFTSVHLRRNGGEHHSEFYIAMNPQQLVPTLLVDGAAIAQSLAIIEWLDETYIGAPLLPSDRMERAQVRAFAQSIACDVHPLQNLRVLAYLRDELGQDQSALDAWCQRWIGDGLLACEIILAGRARTPFCFGDQPCLADICLAPQVFSAQRFGVAMDAMPNVRRVMQACDQLDAFRNAHPSRQPDAE